jgi:hypothetical protein
MSGSRIRVIGAVAIAILLVALSAIAQTRSDETVSSASPATFPAWPIRGIRTSRCHRRMMCCVTWLAVQRPSVSGKRAIFSFPPTGIPTIIRPCPKSLRVAGSRMCARVALVTEPKARGVRRTQALRVFQPPISCSRWRTIKAARESFLARREIHPADDRSRQGSD